jgi:transposase InsO family protein
MDNIFIVQIDGGWLIIYMDDMLICADTIIELRARTRVVLQLLRDNDLYIKGEKCDWEVEEVEMLGTIIRHGEAKMSPRKIKAIVEWPIPTTPRETRSFVGIANFYRNFIRFFSNIARPLHDLTKKDIIFKWTEECQQAFDTLKKRFVEEPILILPDQSKPFQIESDASKYASGAVLMQDDLNGKTHPCAFYSQSFSPAERNYHVYERELLGIIRALREWRQYIQGAQFPVTIFSDHQNLQYWKQPQDLNPRQARWQLDLSNYDINLVHKPGVKMIQSDALSRRPDHIPAEDNDNEQITVLSPELFLNLIDTELQKKIANNPHLDFDAASAIKSLLGSDLTHIQDSLRDWSLEMLDDKPLLFYQGKHYIPKDLELRREIVRKHHDARTAGHPGELETFNQVKRHYWWPGLRTFVKNYVSGCIVCQQFKINRQPAKPSLIPIPPPKSLRPFDHVSWDFITDLPESCGYDAIFSIVDHGLTKGIILIPVTKKMSSEDVALKLVEHLYKRFGLPSKIISDRGKNLASAAFREFLKLLGIESSLSTAYHPQSDGTTERYNQEIEAYLSIYCYAHPETWSNDLPILEFVHNARRHSDRQETSFELILGIQPRAIPETFETTQYASIEDKMTSLERTRKEAIAAHELAANRMAARIRSTFKPFEKGQQVWLDSKNLAMPYATKKMAPRCEGPFTITEVLGPVSYRLKLPATWQVHDVFHAALLSPFRTNDVYGPAFPKPPPDLVNGQEEYEVEAIVRHRMKAKKREYYVKWVGYPHWDNTWQKRDTLLKAQDILDSYERVHPINKPARRYRRKT